MSPANQRHEGLDIICARLHRIILAEEAKQLLAANAIPARATFRVMPSWDWRLPLINLGRKQLDENGKPTLLMPVRLSWECGAIQITEQLHPGDVAGRAIGLGHDHEITTKDFPPLSRERLARSQINSRLRTIVEDGNVALWEQLIAMDSQINKTVMKAHASVSKELANSGHDEESVLDSIDLEGVVSALTLGYEPVPGEKPKKSSFYRMIALMTQPTAFRAVEPLRFMAVHLSRDAKAVVRKRLDDPHVGPKVRQLARELPHLEIAALVKEYNKRYPHDHLSQDRANRALTVQPAPHARRVSAVEDYHLTHTDDRFDLIEEHARRRRYSYQPLLGRVA